MTCDQKDKAETHTTMQHITHAGKEAAKWGAVAAAVGAGTVLTGSATAEGIIDGPTGQTLSGVAEKAGLSAVALSGAGLAGGLVKGAIEGPGQKNWVADHEKRCAACTKGEVSLGA
jgi:imidazole glycerol phosphate synthase subunit HisF